VSPNGDVYIAGVGPTLADNRRRVNLYNISGDSITSFSNPPQLGNSEGACVLKVQADGKIIYNESYKWLNRLHPDGQLDTTFGTGGQALLNGIDPAKLTIAPDGRIVLAGMSLGEGAKIVVFDADGQPDSNFANNGVFELSIGDLDFFFDIKFQEDGKIVACGFSHYSSGSTRSMLLCRLTPDGVLDPGFGDGGYRHYKFSNVGGEFYGIALQPDNKIVATGYDFNPYRGFVARYHTNGVIDSTFGKHGVSFFNNTAEGVDLLIRPDGRILIYGYGDPVSYAQRASLLQFLPNGKPDMSFGTLGEFISPYLKVHPPMAMLPFGDNKVVVCGVKDFPIPNTSGIRLNVLKRIILDLSLGTLLPPTKQAVEQVLIYPNPVGTSFTLKFKLDTDQTLQFELHDTQGRRLQTLLGQQRFARGEYEQSLEIGSHLPPGHYVLSIQVGGAKTMALQLIKG